MAMPVLFLHMDPGLTWTSTEEKPGLLSWYKAFNVVSGFDKSVPLSMTGFSFRALVLFQQPMSVCFHSFSSSLFKILFQICSIF